MRTLVELCLRVAIQRWPESMRGQLAREWSAELYHLGHWGRLRFAWSLAVSPPVNEDGVPVGWRETVPAFGRGLQPLLALFAAGLLCTALAAWLPELGATLLEAVRGRPWPVVTFDWAANSVSVASIALAAVVALLAGRWMGARIPVRWAHRGRLSRIGSAVPAPACVAGAAALARMMQEAGFEDRGGTLVYVPDYVPALVFWAVCFTFIAPLAAKRRWLTAAVATLVALDLTAIVAAWGTAHETMTDLATAPLWFPLALLDLMSSGIRFGEISQGFVASQVVVQNAAGPVRVCLIASVFVLGYALAASVAHSRAMPARAAAQQARLRPALPGGLIAAAGLALWVYGLTALTGALNDVTDPVGEHHIWAHEIRQAAILVMVTGLVLAVAGRGPVLFPALLALPALWAADSAFDAADAAGASAAALAVGIGVSVLYGAWLLARIFRTDEIAARRSLAGFAVFAALCAPAVALHWPTWDTLLPTGFFAASALAVGLLTLAAMLCAAAVRGEAGGLAAAVVAVSAGLASTLTVAGAPVFPMLAGAPLVVIAIWFMLPRRELRGRAIGKGALILLGALVAGIPVAYVQLYSAFLFADALMNAAGYTFPVDGLPILPGSILVGTACAAIIASRLFPREPITDTALEAVHIG